MLQYTSTIQAMRLKATKKQRTTMTVSSQQKSSQGLYKEKNQMQLINSVQSKTDPHSNPIAVNQFQ